MNDFSKLLEHFTLFRTLAIDSWKSTTGRSTTVFTAGSVQQCTYQRWRFTLHSQGLNNLRKGNAAIPTDLDSPALATRVTVLLGIDKGCKGLVPHSLWYKPLATKRRVRPYPGSVASRLATDFCVAMVMPILYNNSYIVQISNIDAWIFRGSDLM